MEKLKLTAMIVALSLLMVVAIQSISVMWTSFPIHMHAGVADKVSLAIFEDCGCTTRVEDIYWGSSPLTYTNSLSRGKAFYYGKDTITKGNWTHAIGSPLGVYGSYAHILPNPPRSGLETAVGNFSVPVGIFNYTSYNWTANQISGLPLNKTDPPYWDEYVSLLPPINYSLTGMLTFINGIGWIQHPVFEWAWDNFNSSDIRACYFTNGSGVAGPGTRLTCWDDGAEATPFGSLSESHFNVTMSFPEGAFMLSLYAYNKEGAGLYRDNQTIYVTDTSGKILATGTMKGTEFYNGMYLNFVVCGPTTIVVQVKKSPASLNALLSGIFIDKFTPGVSQDQTYEFPIYVLNTGTQGLWISYLPHDVFFDDNQAQFSIDCFVVEQGLPCQLTNMYPFQLPVKNYMYPTQGYFLNPGKVIKVIIELHVISLVSGHSYDWDFLIEGATGDGGTSHI